MPLGNLLAKDDTAGAAMKTDLIVIIVIFAGIVIGSIFKSRRSKRNGGFDRAERRRETIAANPT
jgi:hypothetical protein